MARPRAAGYEEQREQIRSAAAALFARLGYTAATMSGVAAASGVSKATLYHYFSDKHALLEDIVRSHVARLEHLVEDAVPQAPGGPAQDPETRLRELTGRLMRAYQGAQNEHRVLTEDVKFLEPGARDAVLGGQRRVVTAFAQAIADCRPDLEPALRKPLAMLLFGMINWTFTWLEPDGALNHEAVGEIAADLLLGGLPAVRSPQRVSSRLTSSALVDARVLRSSRAR